MAGGVKELCSGIAELGTGMGVFGSVTGFRLSQGFVLQGG